MVYDGWLARISRKFQKAFEEIEAQYGFDYGDETEVAICRVLRDLLPKRAAVCRGSIVTADDSTGAGDDIVVLAAARGSQGEGIAV